MLLVPPPRGSFNPCCAGCGFQTRVLCRSCNLTYEFQSLLCWMWVSDCQGRDTRDDRRAVSILVVLDVGFRLYGHLRPGIDTSCFNPCCAGCGFQTYACPHVYYTGDKFQSLLCWMWVSDFIRKALITHKPRVSILVVLDVGFRHPVVPGRGGPGGVSILVVLDVGFRLWTAGGISDGGRRCFNPCCAGCGFQTLSNADILVSSLSFQSLLCWMWVSDVVGSHARTSRWSFQSLLCWMWVSDVVGSHARTSRWSFQSLLCWMWVSDDPTPQGCAGDHEVSILVVLDVGFRLQVAGRRVGRVNVSILVVLDVGFRRTIPDPYVAPPDVSILVVLDVGFRHDVPVDDGRTAGRVSILVVLDVGFRLLGRHSSPH